MFGKTASEVCDGVDEFVCDIEKELYKLGISRNIVKYDNEGKQKVCKLTSSTSGSIFTFGSMLDTKS